MVRPSLLPPTTRLASAHDGSIRLWDTRMASTSVTIMGHMAAITSIDWNPNEPGEFVTTSPSSLDQMVKIWDAEEKGQPKGFFRSSQVSKARYTPFDNGLVTTVFPRARAPGSHIAATNFAIASTISF